MVEQLGVKLDPRGNVAVGEDWMSSVPGVFAAGDMRRGQSLVVWAISEGRKAARAIDQFLMGESRWLKWMSDVECWMLGYLGVPLNTRCVSRFGTR